MPAPKQTILFLSFLSLGGLPPFLGFLPKWVVLNSVLGGGLYVISLLIIVTSLFILFYYLRMAFSAFILGGIKTLSVTGIGLTSGLALRLLSLSLGGLPLFLYV
jgi:NADH:ubiquinone oxidoreductase subunit 2 (subunit N)